VSRQALAQAAVVAVRPDGRHRRPDWVVTEEPMEIRVRGAWGAPVNVSVTMRTPGHDFDLAAGFLFTEGLIGPADIRSVRYCTDDLEEQGTALRDGAPHRVPLATGQQYNTVTVDLRRPFDESVLSRRFASTSACGVCGKATLDDVSLHCAPVGAGPVVPAKLIPLLPGLVAPAQRVFERTGGLHAAALFDRHGVLQVVREDVGRHNAVDKVIGSAVLSGGIEALAECLLMVSGRVGYEIIQKAVVAAIPIVVAVSAPSTLAVEAAERFGVTVVAFLRGESFNVYTHEERLSYEG
jgi:FdhD protein